MFTVRSISAITRTISSSLSGALRTPLYRCLATNGEKFKISYNYGHGDSVLIGSTIGQALNKVSDEVGDQLAFVFCHQNIRRTFLETNQESDQLAASLLELGLRPGERLAIWSSNCYEWVLTQLAAAKAGLILVRTLRRNEKLREVKELDSKIQFDDPANIQFTSGTTGKPKAATLSHFNLINNAVVLSNRIIIPGVVSIVVNYTFITVLSYLVWHAFGSVGGVITTIIHRKLAVFPSPHFDPLATLKAIEKERCTLVMGTPTMFIDIVNHPDVDKFDLTSLQGALVGASPCPVELWKEIEQKMGITTIFVSF
ncbi:acyl-CoA synthetase family member 2, mitochondrial-like [Limulus polyphemus]|uniref:Medium-chain acyl-CoA ligase ACSF2, mitochondrial n=1 Tax=Limulus polyphemus TaxID=6850 RepID=A0ABM1ST57_LIMPO|nr:acyl-CoA synthetase family member 2, mitochondrial-like [Limulus polyphemus]